MALRIGKTPIVVPREKRYDEYVNDYLIKFCKEVESKKETIVVVENVDKLDNVIENYDNMKKKEKQEVIMLNFVQI